MKKVKKSLYIVEFQSKNVRLRRKAWLAARGESRSFADSIEWYKKSKAGAVSLALRIIEKFGRPLTRTLKVYHDGKEIHF